MNVLVSDCIAAGRQSCAKAVLAYGYTGEVVTDGAAALAHAFLELLADHPRARLHTELRHPIEQRNRCHQRPAQ